MNIVHKGGKVVPKIIDNPREIILDQARDIVVNEGFGNLTIRRVSKNTGIAVGTIYNYFPTKDDLILQLMEDYWYSYFKEVERVHDSEEDMYKKLQLIFEKLSAFVDTFKEVWVKNVTMGYTEDSLTRKKSFNEKLIRKLQTILLAEVEKGKINLTTESYATAKFIMLNFYTMAQMRDFKYEEFEQIIRKLF